MHALCTSKLKINILKWVVEVVARLFIGIISRISQAKLSSHIY